MARFPNNEISSTWDATGVTNITEVVETVDGSSTHTQYPTAKAVFDLSVSGDTSTLESTLANGNTTGGNDIVMTTTDAISFDSGSIYDDGNIYIEGDTAGVLIIDDNGAEYEFLSSVVTFSDVGYLQFDISTSDTIISYTSPNGSGYVGNLGSTGLTDDRNWRLPDADGTIALTTDILFEAGSGSRSIIAINSLLPNTASGDNANAFNYGTNATGGASHAEGYLTDAIGNISHAEGNVTKSIGSYSHSQGRFTIASGITSHVGGYGYGTNYEVIASGLASFNHSYRANTTPNVSGATGDYSVILGGLDNSSIGYGSSIFGTIYGVSSGQVSTLVGGAINTVTSNYSSIMGGAYNTITDADSSSIVGGSNNTITGTNPVKSFIAGGEYNTINDFSVGSNAIIGGSGNTNEQQYNIMLGCVNRTGSGALTTDVERLNIFSGTEPYLTMLDVTDGVTKYSVYVSGGTLICEPV